MVVVVVRQRAALEHPNKLIIEYFFFQTKFGVSSDHHYALCLPYMVQIYTLVLRHSQSYLSFSIIFKLLVDLDFINSY